MPYVWQGCEKSKECYRSPGHTGRCGIIPNSKTPIFTEEKHKECLDILMRDADKYKPSTSIGILTSEILRLRERVRNLEGELEVQESIQAGVDW